MTTSELKTDFTLKMGDAIGQYRFDCPPKGKGTGAEPLLSFPGGAMVYFAVSNSEVRLVTKLAGPATVFLPFNHGDDGAEGNPGDTARLISGSAESEKLRQQAVNNPKEQFPSSPDLSTAILHAIMEAYDAHTAMSTQALNSDAVQKGLKTILLQHAGLWESLRRRQAG